jgi:hypothetical protein
VVEDGVGEFNGEEVGLGIVVCVIVVRLGYVYVT